jgi:5-methylcytosine-specific restriction endonuclease McrA
MGRGMGYYRATKRSQRAAAKKRAAKTPVRSLSAGTLNPPFYETDAWLRLRFKTLLRFGAVCMLCRATKGEMHVDHIIPRSKAPERELDETNLQVLCRACNLGKSNTDSTDFRPKG